MAYDYTDNNRKLERGECSDCDRIEDMTTHTPITDEELDEMEEWAKTHRKTFYPTDVIRLIAEVRALRGNMEKINISDSNMPQSGFIKIHVRPFAEGGYSFAECMEMKLVARGGSEGEAIVKLLNMVTASLQMAILQGNLNLVLENAGLEVFPSIPDSDVLSDAGILDSFMPVPADARVKPPRIIRKPHD